MKYLRILFISFIVVSCQKNNQAKAHVALGTWNYCAKNGNYEECIITNDFMLIMSTQPKKNFLLRNKIVDSNLVLSTLKGEINLPMSSDTLVTIEQSKNRVILKSYYSPEDFELHKVEFDFNPIDWANLESWKNKIQSEFKKRVEF